MKKVTFLLGALAVFAFSSCNKCHECHYDLNGSEVDYVSELIGESFKITNPQSKSSCGCGVSFSL